MAVWSNDNSFRVLTDLLDALSVKINRRYLRKLLDNPLGDSLRGISDALDSIGIENDVYKLPCEYLNAMKTPFIASVKNAMAYCLITSISDGNVLVRKGGKEQIIPYELFVENYNGTILIAQNSKGVKDERFVLIKNIIDILCQTKNTFMIILLILFSLLCVHLIKQEYNFFSFFHLVLLFMCVIISGAIFYRENYDNSFLNRYCKIGRFIDCNKIISYGNINDKWNLSYISLVFFSSSILYFIVSDIPMSLAVAFSYIYFVFGLLSIIIQFFFKKWCLFCSLLDFVMIFDFVYLNVYNHWRKDVVEMSEFFLFLLFLLLVYLVSMQILKFIERYNEQIEFKKKYSHLLSAEFSRMILNMGENKPNFSYNKADEYLSNNDITIIISLRCRNCQKICDACKEFGTNTSLNIVLYSIGEDMKYEELILKILSVMLSDGQEKGLQLINKWFKRHDFNDFKDIIILEEGKTLFDQQRQYCEKLCLDYVPIVILNGKLVPKIYRFNDIKYLL